jgi:hypothetical protein
MINTVTLQILNTIGTWLAGIGTLSAVIVSLYLARRESSTKLSISAGHRILVTPGQKAKPDYCVIRIVNIGFRPAKITGIGWKVGMFKKRYWVQTTQSDHLSSQLPIKLEHGDEASYFIAFVGDGTYPNWIDSFAKDTLGKKPDLNQHTIKVQVFSSVGKMFEKKIEKGLRQRIVETAINKKPNPYQAPGRQEVKFTAYEKD